MKKFIIILVCLILFVLAGKEVMSRYPEKFQKITEIQKWLEPWKEKAESVTDDIAGQISDKLPDQKWEQEGNYDIDADTAGWFESDREILSGRLDHTKINEGMITDLILWAAGCQVEIAESGEDFIISFEKMKKVQIYQEGTGLVIKGVRDTELGSGEENSVLKLYVPEGTSLTNVELELGAGSMQVDALSTKSLKISVEAGKLTGDDVQAAVMEVSLGAGAVTLNHVSVQNADLSVGAGNMIVKGNILGNVGAKCAMGNLQMYLDGAEEDFDYEVVCMAGNIKIDEETYSGIHTEKTIDHNAGKNMNLDCAVGNMTIAFPDASE